MSEDLRRPEEELPRAEAPAAVPGRARPVLEGREGVETAQIWISAFLVVVVGVIAYGNSLGGPFHTEDYLRIVYNEPVHHLTTFPQALDARLPRPLTMLTFALNWWLLPGNAAAFHVINMLLHVVNGVLLYLLCRRLLVPRASEAAAMLAGLLFAAHPLATEAVNYIICRSALLATMFMLAALLLFLRATEKEDGAQPVTLGLSVFCFALASWSKETAVVFPALVLAVDWLLRGGRGFGRRVVLHCPYWALLSVLIAVRLAAGRDGVPRLPNLPLADIVATQSVAFAKYLRLTLLPFGLSADHALSVQHGFMSPESVAALLLVLGVGCLSVILLLRRSPAGLALFWYLIVLAPSSLFAPPDAVMAERRAYLAIAGGVLLVPWLVGKIKPKPLRVAMGVAAGVAVLICTGATFSRNATWQSRVSLWADAADKSPRSSRAYGNLGRAFIRRARLVESDAAEYAVLGEQDSSAQNAREAQDYLNAAEDYCRKAVRLDPGNFLARLDLGTALNLLERYQEGEDVLLDALSREPSSEACMSQLLSTLSAEAGVADAHADQVRLVDYYRRAAQLKPLSEEQLARYGLCLMSVGDFRRASSILAQAVDGDESSPHRAALEQARRMASDVARVEAEVWRGRREHPASSAEQRAMARTYLMAGRHLQCAYLLWPLLENAPNDPELWVMLGYTRAKMGAIDAFLARWPAPLAASQEPRLQLAQACARGGAWDAVEKVLAAGGSGMGSPITLGALALDVGALDRAESYLREAGAADPANPVPWLYLCDVAVQREDAAAAGGYLDEAEARSVDPAAVSELRARIAGLNPAGGGRAL